jgi:hypothetical protein
MGRRLCHGASQTCWLTNLRRCADKADLPPHVEITVANKENKMASRTAGVFRFSLWIASGLTHDRWLKVAR